MVKIVKKNIEYEMQLLSLALAKFKEEKIKLYSLEYFYLEDVIKSIDSILAKIESDKYMSDDYILHLRHDLICGVIKRSWRSPCNLLSIIVKPYEVSYIDHDESWNFQKNLLCAALFDDVSLFKSGKLYEYKSQTDEIKYFIEQGSDVIYATQYFLAHQNIRGMSLDELRQKFNQTMGIFFRSIHPLRVDGLIRYAGCDRGFYVKKYRCAISNNIPIFPVLCNGKIYDLFDLSLKLKAKYRRETPYEFMLDGIEVDSHKIQFYSGYSSWVFKDLKNSKSYENLYDQTKTILSYNREFTMWLGIFSLVIIATMQLLYLVAPNLFNDKSEPSGDRYSTLFLIVKISAGLVSSAKPKWGDETPYHLNYFIRNIHTFNAICMLSMCTISFGLIFSGGYKSVTVFPVLPFNRVDLNVIFNVLSVYVIGFSAYMAAALYMDKELQPEYSYERNRIHPLYEEPKIHTISPFFDKQKYKESQYERNHQRNNFTLCLNRWVATGKAQPQLAGSAKETNPLIEKILDYNFGENFVRHSYR